MVWNFKPSMRPFRFVGHKGIVHDVKVSPTGNIIASCSADHTIRLWNNTVEGHS
jgi:centriolar protein POC1